MLSAAKNLADEFQIDQQKVEYEIVFTQATALLRSKNANNRKSGNCGDKYSNCRNKADVTLSLSTAACIGAVFVPVVGVGLGPMCQVYALYSHYTDVEKCGLDYQDCAGS